MRLARLFGEGAGPGCVGLVLGASLARDLALGGAVPLVRRFATRADPGGFIRGVERLLLGRLRLRDVGILAKAHDSSMPAMGPEGERQVARTGKNRRRVLTATGVKSGIRAIVLTTNLDFSQWQTVFPSAASAAALIDRLIHHSRIISIQVESDRKRVARAPPPGVTVKAIAGPDFAGLS